jgi:hypothetical protein
VGTLPVQLLPILEDFLEVVVGLILRRQTRIGSACALEADILKVQLILRVLKAALFRVILDREILIGFDLELRSKGVTIGSLFECLVHLVSLNLLLLLVDHVLYSADAFEGEGDYFVGPMALRGFPGLERFMQPLEMHSRIGIIPICIVFQEAWRIALGFDVGSVAILPMRGVFPFFSGPAKH